MDIQQNRTHSPPHGGQSRQNNGSLSSSPPQYPQHSPGGLSPTAGFNPGAFNAGMQSNAGDQYGFADQGSYLNATSQAPAYQQPTLPSNGFPGQEMDQAYRRNSNSSQQRPTQLSIPESNHQFQSNFNNPFPSQGDNNFVIDPSLQGPGQQQNQSINPADIMGNMSPQQESGATPPSLMQMDARHSPKHSPSMQQGQFYSPGHSRHASLDPASANIPHGQQGGEWSGMLGSSFQQHRRAPSEHSDISSVNHSPFVKQEGFEAFDQSHSPLLNAQQDTSVYQGALGIERFTLSDGQPQPGMSPRHSPYPSPRMSPNHGIGVPPDNQFILPSNDPSSQFGGGPGPQIYTSQDNEPGLAHQMPPPEIQVDFAPPSKGMDHSRNENDSDALSPPERGMIYPSKNRDMQLIRTGRRNRLRAKSDPAFAPMRSMSPTPHLVTADPNQRHRSLSPFDANFPTGDRELSPGAKSSRRSSTSSIPNRDYILELADPSRPSASSDNRRVQKHPATFQCTLCPKRFTRAYNLRSHLRTHTDERPFVCTVCGKAFARQHDRKRHEGLHSGEKKFVCKGDLSNSGSWGCGRRFARADALGRHFRSEAGRVCIKPLLDEEAAERQRQYEEQILSQQGMHPGMAPPQAMDVSNGGFTLPQALLAQYPALQGLQWDQLGAAGPADDGEISGRSSFDAGSGGDFYDEEEGSGYVSGPGTAYGTAWGGGGGPEWASDYEGR